MSWWRGAVWLFLGAVCPLAFTGCSSGTIALVVFFLLDDDDDGRSRGPQEFQGPVTVAFERVENNRRRPSRTLLTFRLSSDGSGTTDVRIEFTVDGIAFAPLAFREPLPQGSSLAEPGVLSGLLTSRAGVSHQVGWDAVSQLGGTQLARVTLRLTASNAVDVPVLVGNDPPEVEGVRFRDAGSGTVTIEVVLADSSADPVDLEIRVSTVLEDPAEGDFGPITVPGGTQGLPSAVEGRTDTLSWLARDDLGPLDRDVIVRLVPRDLVGAETEGVGAPREAPAFLDLNSDPEVRFLEIARGEEDGDRRRGVPVVFAVADAEGDEVDVVVQWAPEGEDFPALPSDLDSDPEGREALLLDEALAPQRAALRIATLRAEAIDGPVEDPAPGVGLAEREILATWIARAAELRGGPGAVSGRGVQLARASGAGAGAAGERLACEYTAQRGVLGLGEPFAPLESPGDRLRIELAGPTRLPADAKASALRHVVWASDLDLPGGGPVRIRVTPFDRSFALSDDPAASCEPPPPYSLSGARPGDRGAARETETARVFRGPFGGRGAWIVPLAPVDSPVAVAAADLDRDGRLDLAAASRSSRSLVLSFQTAPGSFDQLRLLDERIGEPSDVLVADLDRDGDLDIALPNSTFMTDPVPEKDVPSLERPGSVLLYFQDPGLDFIPNRVSLTAGSTLRFPSSIGAADLDRDGDLDLAVAEASGPMLTLVVFYRGGRAGPNCADAGGGYSACTLRWTAPGVATPGGLTDLELADIDADGDTDAIACFAQGFTLIANDGAARLSVRGTITVPGADIRSLAFADIDGDGVRELLGADASAGEVVVLRETAPQVFEPAAPLRPTDLLRPVALLAGDVDGNGHGDLLIADEGTSGLPGSVTVCLGGAANGLTCDALRRQAAALPSPRALALGDFDGDGLDDIASADEGPREVAVYLQEAPGRFARAGETLHVLEAQSAPALVAAADVDGNLFIDLAVASPSSARLSVLRQGADGTLEEDSFVDPGTSGYSDLALGDVDGDGLGDLVTASADSDAVVVRFQSAAGGFGTAAVVRSLATGEPPGARSVAIGDFDGDGRLDIVTAGRFSNSLSWFPQVTPRQFGAPEALDTSAVGRSVFASPIDLDVDDLDQDGRADIAVAAHASDTVWIFTQPAEEHGTFAASLAVALPARSRPFDLELADFDGDGDVDIAVAGEGEPALVVLDHDDGKLSFTARDLSPLLGTDAGAGATSVSSADVDADGRLDLAVASPSAGAISVLSGTPAGGFAQARVLRGVDFFGGEYRFAPAAVLAIDLDGDGERDLVAANQAAGSLTVFWGGR